MKKIAKLIRVVTVSPFIALVLITTLNLTDKAFTGSAYLGGLITLTLLPLLAYPIQRHFKVIKGESRSSERKLAIIFSVLGYLIGFICSLIFSDNNLEKITFLTYLLSVVLIFISTFVFKVNASGHACGVSGPIAIIVYVHGPIYLFLSLVLGLVIWSSLYLKRHRVIELVIGGIIPIVSLIISIVIY